LEEFSSEINRTIGFGTGVGFSVHINGFENITFVRVELLDTSEYSFISVLLRSNGQEIDYPSLDSNGGNKLVHVTNFEERLAQDLIIT
jgi:hypothetical protein